MMGDSYLRTVYAVEFPPHVAMKRSGRINYFHTCLTRNHGIKNVNSFTIKLAKHNVASSSLHSTVVEEL